MSTIEKAVEKLELKRDCAVKPDKPATIQSDASGKEVSGTAVAKSIVVEKDSSLVRSEIEKTFVEIPLKKFAEAGMVTPFAPRSRVAEELRSIKRPLLRNIDLATASQETGTRLIMVTSALQGDGKTFTSLNLAMSIAMEQDRTVLFVDADVSKADAARLLDIPPGSMGLIDVLENKGVALADVILPTSIDNFRVLPAGNVHERSTELLASQSMHELMQDLSNRYPDRVIVFDSPPLLLTTEASVLASFMGQIVFVVCTDQTPQEAVTKSLESIGSEKIIGMVLNKSHSRRNNFFGLGYNYVSGYGYDRNEATMEKGS